MKPWFWTPSVLNVVTMPCPSTVAARPLTRRATEAIMATVLIFERIGAASVEIQGEVNLLEGATALLYRFQGLFAIGSRDRRWVGSRRTTSASWRHHSAGCPVADAEKRTITSPCNNTGGTADRQRLCWPIVGLLIEYPGIASTATPKAVNSGTQRPRSDVLALYTNALRLVASCRL